MNHTPGPYEAVNVSLYSCEIRDATGFVVATVRHTQQDEMDGRKGGVSGNAALLASAPDLLAACRAIVAVLTQPVQFSPQANADILRGDAATAVRFAQAAIARAERGGE